MWKPWQHENFWVYLASAAVIVVLLSFLGFWFYMEMVYFSR